MMRVRLCGCGRAYAGFRKIGIEAGRRFWRAGDGNDDFFAMGRIL
jgi:hypothetical protein